MEGQESLGHWKGSEERDDYLLSGTDKRRRQRRVKNRKVWMMGVVNGSCWWN